MDAPGNSEILVFRFFGSCPMHMIWGLVKLQKTILKKSLFKLHSAQLFSILFRNHRFMLWWKVLERCFMPYGSTKWKTENTIVLLGFHIMTYFKHFIKHKPLIFENSEFFFVKSSKRKWNSTDISTQHKGESVSSFTKKCTYNNNSNAVRIGI